jgi:hypothetical protein
MPQLSEIKTVADDHATARDSVRPRRRDRCKDCFRKSFGAVLRAIFSMWGFVVNCVSFEFLLTSFELPNGGSIILMRSIASGLLVYGASLLLMNWLDPCPYCKTTFYLEQVSRTLHWLGSIIAVLYAGLYARFSSQWTYLANVYNQIKTAETRLENAASSEALAEWKAGFIEDADVLHLAAKPIFASVIRAWAEIDAVRTAFDTYSPGGRGRWTALMKRVDAAFAREAKKHSKAMAGA